MFPSVNLYKWKWITFPLNTSFRSFQRSNFKLRIVNWALSETRYATAQRSSAFQSHLYSFRNESYCWLLYFLAYCVVSNVLKEENRHFVAKFNLKIDAKFGCHSSIAFYLMNCNSQYQVFFFVFFLRQNSFHFASACYNQPDLFHLCLFSFDFAIFLFFFLWKLSFQFSLISQSSEIQWVYLVNRLKNVYDSRSENDQNNRGSRWAKMSSQFIFLYTTKFGT